MEEFVPNGLASLPLVGKVLIKPKGALEGAPFGLYL
jgi:hypothetical protein